MRYLRPTAIAGLLVAAATLSSCGFHYPTDRVNTVSAGVNNRDASVDALGIRVLASAKGKGRLIGSLANNTREDATLDSISSPDGSVEAEFKPVKVPGRSGVNLAEENIPVTGDFTAGEFVDIALEFSTGETVSLEAPVVKPCYQYSEIPTPSAPASESPSKGASQGASDSASPAASESASPEASESASDEATEDSGDTFKCSDEAEVPETPEGE